MFPLRREQECETIVQFMADTVAGRSSKVLAVVGNCGCGKTSSLTSVSQCFSTREGRELYQKYLFANNNNTNNNNTKERIRYPRLEYVHSAEKSFKLLLAEMTDRIKNPTATGGFFAANVAPNAINGNNINVMTHNTHTKNKNTSSSKSKAAAAKKKKKAAAKRKRKNDDSDDDNDDTSSSEDDDDHPSNSSDDDDRLAELAKSTANKLKDEFASALAMQACIGGVTNNYISGHGAVVEDYRQLMAPPTKKNITKKILTRAANNPNGNNGRVHGALKKRKIEEEEENDDIDIYNDGVPFCFLVLDEIDTPGSGWRDSQSRELMEKILSVKSIGIILIANRTDLKWLPPKMSQYLTFNPYKGEDLALIAKQKMSMKSLVLSSKNNNKKFTISSLSSSSSGEEMNSTTGNGDNNSNSLFNEGALNYVGMFVAKNQAGDVRKVTDHCKTAVANKIISWHQQEQKILEEKRTREDMERMEAQQNSKTTNTRKGAKNNSNVIIDTSSLPSSTRTSTNSLTSSSGGRKNANASPKSTTNNKNNNSDMMLMMVNDFLAASAAAASTSSNSQQRQPQHKEPSFSLDIKTNDVMLAAKSSNDHIGVEMLSALPDHVRLVMWCVANAVRVNQAAQELRQQNAQHQFQYNFNTNSRTGNSSFARNSMNSGSDSAQLDKNYLYTSYQNLTKKLNVVGGSHTGFGDALSTLVDMRLLSSDDSKTHYTLFVHQDEIKPAMMQIEKKYSITEELVRTL